MTGSTIAAAIPVAISPILTRLYTPEEFGIFAVLGVLIAFFISFSSLRYDVAIMLPESEEDAKHLVFLSSALTTLLCALLVIILILWRDGIARLLGSPKYGEYLYSLPVLLFFLGQYSIMSHYLGRHKRYNYLSQSKILESSLGSAGHIALGLQQAGVWGLIIGQILGIIAGCVYLSKKMLNLLKKGSEKLTPERARFLAVRYSNFPKYDVASTALGSLSANLHIILFSILFGESIVGIVTLATRIISKPLLILSGSFSQVFYQKISSYRNTDDLFKSYTNGVKKLSLISLPLIIVTLLIPNEFITWTFGSNWSDVGAYLKILTFWYCIQFIGSSVSAIYNVLEMQRFVLWFQLIGTVLTVLTIGYGYYKSLSDIATLQLFVLGKAIIYFYLIIHPYLALKVRLRHA